MHCHAHRLNLVLVDTVKSVQEAADFFALLERLYVFLSRSYVHQKYAQVQKKMYPGKPQRELHRLSDTRWACRYFSCRNTRDRLPAILKTLQDISDEDNADRAIDARGLASQLDFTFTVMLTVFCNILQESKGLSNMLQNPEVDLAKAVDIVDTFKNKLQKL